MLTCNKNWRDPQIHGFSFSQSKCEVINTSPLFCCLSVSVQSVAFPQFLLCQFFFSPTLSWFVSFPVCAGVLWNSLCLVFLCSPACDNLRCLTCVNYPTCVWFLPLVLNLSVFPLSVFLLGVFLCVPASCLSSCFIVQQITFSLHHTSLCTCVCIWVQLTLTWFSFLMT